ncbi:hypothetical protein HMPREF1051_0659 [Neisseria sicca VK64]|uniref:Uncharacterized protein n=1 Tax=Neisseria sicca VK64 TaxID=1095748 RepID=I2NL18_NEISI|nr:hypothetical protein HMPREF1051_0659 [Neisseria sicca VK64]
MGKAHATVPGYDGFGDHSLYYFEHTKTGLFFFDSKPKQR